MTPPVDLRNRLARSVDHGRVSLGVLGSVDRTAHRARPAKGPRFRGNIGDGANGPDRRGYFRRKNAAARAIKAENRANLAAWPSLRTA